MARSLAWAPLNWYCQGQPWGRCKVWRRAWRVRLPARENRRRRWDLMVITGSPRLMRAVQRARLWAKTPYRVRSIFWTASQAPLARERPEGIWLRPTPYFRSRMAFSTLAWRLWSASRSRELATSRVTVHKYTYAEKPPTRKPSAKERAKLMALRKSTAVAN